MTLSDLEMRDTKGPFLLRIPMLPRAMQFGKVTLMGRGVFLGVSHASMPALANFRTHINFHTLHLTKYGMITSMERGMFLRVGRTQC